MIHPRSKIPKKEQKKDTKNSAPQNQNKGTASNKEYRWNERRNWRGIKVV